MKYKISNKFGIELIADHPFVSVFVLFGTVTIIQAIDEVIEVIVKYLKNNGYIYNNITKYL